MADSGVNRVHLFDTEHLWLRVELIPSLRIRPLEELALSGLKGRRGKFASFKLKELKRVHNTFCSFAISRPA